MAKEKNPDIKFVERKRWLFLGLPFTFTKFIIQDDVITINQGFLNKVENDCYMYKVQDVEHKASLLERICGLEPSPALRVIPPIPSSSCPISSIPRRSRIIFWRRRRQRVCAEER